MTFTKVDGTVRTMPCTLDESIIPPIKNSQVITDELEYPDPSGVVRRAMKPKKSNPEVLSVWCTDKQEWRSFRVANVTLVEPL